MLCDEKNAKQCIKLEKINKKMIACHSLACFYWFAYNMTSKFIFMLWLIDITNMFTDVKINLKNDKKNCTRQRQFYFLISIISYIPIIKFMYYCIIFIIGTRYMQVIYE